MDTKKILRRIILAGIFLMPFVPLVVSSSLFFPFISGKNFIFRLLVEIVFACWVVLAVSDKSYRLKPGVLVWLLGAFAVVVGLADIFAINPYKAFWSNFERMEGYITILHLLGYFVVLSSVLKTKELWNRLFNTSLAVSVIVSVFGIFQLAGVFVINQGGVRLDGTFGNAIYLAVYVLIHIFLAMFLLLQSLKDKGVNFRTYLYSGTILLELFILYHTATRGAVLGLIGGIIVTAILILWKGDKGSVLRKVAIGGLLGLVALASVFVMIRKTEFVSKSPVLSRFASISVTDSTTKARFLIWGMALQGFQEHPVLGWGQEGFNHVFNKYYDPRMIGQESWFDRAHNVFLDWLIAGGIFAFIFYLALYFVPVYLLWFRNYTAVVFSVPEKAVLTGLLVAYLVNNLFVFDNLVSYIMFFMLLAFFHHLYSQTSVGFDLKKKVNETGVVGADLTRIIGPVVLIALIFSIYFFEARGFLAGRTLISALRQNPDGLTGNLNLFKKVFSYNSFADSEAVEQLAQAAYGVADSKADISMKQAYFSTTDDALAKQLKMAPNDTRYLLFRGRLHGVYRDTDGAIQYLSQALASSPKKQQIMFELGSFYLIKKDFTKALAILKTAYELNTESGEAKEIYAAGAVYAGDQKLAEQIYGKSTKVPTERFINAYAADGDYRTVLELWQKRVAESPDNYQFRFSLAATYLILGERQSAITQIRKAIDLNPALKEQGEYYIHEIEAGRNP